MSRLPGISAAAPSSGMGTSDAARSLYQISRIVTDPPSDAGARIRALGFAA